MLVVVVLGAVQMFVLGMIGEYLGRLYMESKRRPLYIVAEIAGHAGGEPSLGHVAHSAEDQGAETIATSETPGGNGSRPIA
jgi:dolichol-phosphate mannosyltransferase